MGLQLVKEVLFQALIPIFSGSYKLQLPLIEIVPVMHPWKPLVTTKAKV